MGRCRLDVILPLPPSVNHYLQYRIERRGKKQVVRAYPTNDTEAYNLYVMNYLKPLMEEMEWETIPKDKFIQVDCIFYMARARSDCHNYFKVPFDAMTKAGVWEDDDKVIPLVQGLYIDSENPRIEMVVRVLDKVGVFINKQAMDKYKKENCSVCTRRNKSKCTIFKDLLDNKVHVHLTCKKYLNKVVDKK